MRDEERRERIKLVALMLGLTAAAVYVGVIVWYVAGGAA
jgi:hypothetical protein